MKNIDFYFDFISPYAYLANSQLPALAKKYGYSITYRPIDLKAAKLAAGNTGPATAQMPAKLRYAMADFTRWSKKYDVPLAFANVIPVTERANKGVFYAIEKGQAEDYVNALWRATFGSAGDFNSDELLGDVARQMGWSPEEFLEFVQSDAAASLYEEGNKAAQERGVFGAPTMMVGDEMWWGNDRLDLLEEFLAEQS
ncbi:2-hydroxychromene-2-carboxylate isomerase [Emcibacter sp.]|uniref:2-hydroxychromene-2-carboxylate isomerase n=1 Tax=Emcibacter sp. TaxID=1979954 RepID=UPI002AA66C13|nr:2-hydroxychromene-2-carboxylate isomerase [Emcibacter sp.]